MSLPMSDEFKDGTWNSLFFDTVGDESGSIDMAVNGSVTPVDFKVTCPDDKVYYIHRMIGLVEDEGTFESNTFGALAALTNGLKLYVNDGTSDRLMTNQLPIKTNMDWAAYCYDIHVMTGSGLGPSGPDGLTWRFTMTRDGAPFYLVPGTSLIWRVADDLSGLTNMSIRAGMVGMPIDYAPRA